uniref:Movement protein n=1 Tax=Parascaris univalens TaxID=6257 RepID=A0A914ZQ24_PARUN
MSLSSPTAYILNSNDESVLFAILCVQPIPQIKQYPYSDHRYPLPSNVSEISRSGVSLPLSRRSW